MSDLFDLHRIIINTIRDECILKPISDLPKNLQKTRNYSILKRSLRRWFFFQANILSQSDWIRMIVSESSVSIRAGLYNSLSYEIASIFIEYGYSMVCVKLNTTLEDFIGAVIELVLELYNNYPEFMAKGIHYA